MAALKCPKCLFSSPDRDLLRRHIRAVHAPLVAKARQQATASPQYSTSPATHDDTLIDALISGAVEVTVDLLLAHHSTADEPPFVGGGGDFSGAGASGDWGGGITSDPAPDVGGAGSD